MLAELNALISEGKREKVDRQHRMGLGIDWSNQLANVLHKPVRRRFDKRTVLTKQVDNRWTVDLVDMSSFSRSNKGYKYLLVVIDVFSKNGWIVPMKSKTGNSTENEDKSSIVERWNRTMKNILWKYFTANNTQKYIVVLASMVEKYNNIYDRSIKLTHSMLKSMFEKLHHLNSMLVIKYV